MTADEGRDSSGIKFWLPLVVSIVALVASAASAAIGYNQYRTAKDQLAEQEGRLSIDLAYVDLYDAENHAWKNGANKQALAGQRLPYMDFASQDVFITLHVFNISHAPLAISKVGLIADENNKLIEAKPFCDQTGPVSTVSPCNLPIMIKEQTDTNLHLRVNDVEKEISCNQYVNRTGLIGAVETADGRIWSGKTQTFDPFSPVCAGPVAPPSDTASRSGEPGAPSTGTAIPSG
jgi:hypothetical protein